MLDKNNFLLKFKLIDGNKVSHETLQVKIENGKTVYTGSKNIFRGLKFFNKENRKYGGRVNIKSEEVK